MGLKAYMNQLRPTTQNIHHEDQKNGFTPFLNIRLKVNGWQADGEEQRLHIDDGSDKMEKWGWKLPFVSHRIGWQTKTWVRRRSSLSSTIKRRRFTTTGVGGGETEGEEGDNHSPPMLSSILTVMLGGEPLAHLLAFLMSLSCSTRSFLMLPSMRPWSLWCLKFRLPIN